MLATMMVCRVVTEGFQMVTAPSSGVLFVPLHQAVVCPHVKSLCKHIIQGILNDRIFIIHIFSHFCTRVSGGRSGHEYTFGKQGDYCF